MIKHLQVFGRCSFGAFSYSDYGVDIYDADVGRYCSIGSGVKINPGRHPLDFLTTHPVACDWTGVSAGLEGDPTFQAFRASACTRPSGPSGSTRVTIGNDVWIGTNAVIMKGTTIGDGAVIGAGAVVSRDVAPYDIVGGVPAKPIRSRFSRELVKRIRTAEWWNHDLSCLGQRNYSEVEAFLDRLAEESPPRFEPRRVLIGPEGLRAQHAA